MGNFGTKPKRLAGYVTSQNHGGCMNMFRRLARMHASSDELLTGETRERLESYQAQSSLPADMDVAALARAVFSVVNGCYFSWLGGATDDIALLVAAVKEQLAFLLPARPLSTKDRMRRRR
jgi:hypothetical protein